MFFCAHIIEAKSNIFISYFQSFFELFFQKTHDIFLKYECFLYLYIPHWQCLCFSVYCSIKMLDHSRSIRSLLDSFRKISLINFILTSHKKTQYKLIILSLGAPYKLNILFWNTVGNLSIATRYTVLYV